MAAAEQFELKVIFQSQTKGYVKSPDLSKLTSLTGVVVNSTVHVQVPARHAVFISWWIRLKWGEFCSHKTRRYNKFDLYTGNVYHGSRPVWEFCKYYISLPLLHTRLLHVHFVKFVRAKEERFRMLFSFHNVSALPEHRWGVWNCSVPQWPDFQQHVGCNLKRECAGGEDEAGCFYESQLCGPGLLSAAGGCYKYVLSGDVDVDGGTSTWYEAHARCTGEGGYLVSLNTPEEWDAVISLLQRVSFDAAVYAGLKYHVIYNQRIYRDISVWADETVMHYGSLTEEDSFLSSAWTRCTSFTWNLDRLQKHHCTDEDFMSILCEMKSKSSPGLATDAVTLPNITTSDFVSVLVIECPSGHWALSSLVCDLHSACWGQGRGSAYTCNAPLTPLPPSFDCVSGLEYVPYSLVCDFRQDCSDGSDEDFCNFPVCGIDPFPCGNKQCVNYDRQCDGTEDCTNGADEQVCSEREIKNVTRGDLPYGIQRDLPSHYLKVSAAYHCKDTDFKCRTMDMCMPVYLRCNGINDCPGHEDELGCDMCPGFYRCRGSSICIHPVHMCNAIPDCPQHDDEQFCQLPCPEHCTCYALSAYCRHRFSADRISDLRFLEARNSGMTLSDLVNTTFLVHLGLRECGIQHLDNASLPNVQYLDISNNLLTNITHGILLNLPNLRTVLLDGNPLKSIFVENADNSQLQFPPIVHLSLSNVSMKEFDIGMLTVLSDLTVLNLSGNGIERVSGDSLRFLAELSTLDVRECPLTDVPRKLLRGLHKLGAVFANNYKLCCPAMLPEGFNLANCHAPSDEISSCDALLVSNAYRVMLSVFAVLTLVGNLGSFTYRVIINISRGGFGVFVTHLSVSDFLMGVYLAIIGVADRVYLGNYLWADITWKYSIVCSMAGCLSFVSSEVSAFIICLITLDRVLELHLPFSQVRFHQMSAHVASGVAWILGVVLAAVPLVLMTSHRHFYNRNGMCLPLPFSQSQFPGQSYSFNVMIVFNLILYFFIATGQLSIHYTVRTDSVTNTEMRTTSEARVVARRFISVAMSNCLCWFSIGLPGLLVSSGTLSPGDVSVTVFIVTLPLNAALDPFLYSLNVILERRRRENEQRIQRILMAAQQGKRVVVPPS